MMKSQGSVRTSRRARWLVSAVLVIASGLSPVSRGAAVFSAFATNSVTGQRLSASATFNIVGGGSQLQITLSNLGDAVHAPSDILTALFFDLNGTGTLSPVSALLGSGSILVNGPLASGTTLGDYWAYQAGLSGVPGGSTRGISSTGLKLFGQGNFGSHGLNVDGYGNGIINDNASAGNGQIPRTQFERNSVVFTLGGLSPAFNLANVVHVEFQYGTHLAPVEPMLAATLVPEPSLAALAGLAAATFLVLRRPRGNWSPIPCRYGVRRRAKRDAAFRASF